MKLLKKITAAAALALSAALLAPVASAVCPYSKIISASCTFIVSPSRSRSVLSSRSGSQGREKHFSALASFFG